MKIVFNKPAGIHAYGCLIAAARTPLVRIDNIPNEAELFKRLGNGESVLVYRGIKRADKKPSPGRILDRPFGKVYDLRYDSKEEFLEEARIRVNPQLPSRLESVFLAPSAVEAGFWGRIYEVEMRVKDPSAGNFSHAVCWRSYHAYDQVQFMISTELGTDEEIAEVAEKYWTSVGSFRYSEILADPRLVTLRTIGKYSPLPAKLLEEFLDRMMVYSQPHTMLLVGEHIDELYDDPVFKHHSKEQVRKAAARRLISELIKNAKAEIAAVLKGNARLHVDVDEKVTIHPPLWIEEAVRDAGLDKNDQEDLKVLKRFKQFERMIVKIAPNLILKGMEFRATYETKPQANGQCVTELSMQLAAEQYGRACRLAGIKPDKAKLMSILREWGVNTKLRILDEIAAGKYSYYGDAEELYSNFLVALRYAAEPLSDYETDLVKKMYEQMLSKLDGANGLGAAYGFLIKKYERLCAECEKLLGIKHNLPAQRIHR